MNDAIDWAKRPLVKVADTVLWDFLTQFPNKQTEYKKVFTTWTHTFLDGDVEVGRLVYDAARPDQDWITFARFESPEERAKRHYARTVADLTETVQRLDLEQARIASERATAAEQLERHLATRVAA